VAYSEQELRELAQRAAERLTKLPGVHMVGLGGREKDGRPTGQLVLKVFVERKRPLAQLSASEIVPAEFEGLPTDVVETGRFTLAAFPPGQPPLPAQQISRDGDWERYRPLWGGGQVRAKDGPCDGTLGFLATVPADPKQVYALTCHHVLFSTVAGVVGRKCGQPDWGDSSTKCCRTTIGLSGPSHYQQDGIDAALIRLDPGTEWLAEIHQIGFVVGKYDLTLADAQPSTYQLRKRGRTLRLTGGPLQAIGVPGFITPPPGSALPNRHITNGIMISPNPSLSDPAATVWFAQQGDSGAAVVNADNKIVGQIIGVNPQGWGIAQPIADVISTFAADGVVMDVATATKLGDKRIVPNAAPDVAAPTGFELPAAVRQMQIDLDRTAQGRDLVSVWLRHSTELNQLVNHNRRVAVAWRRANGPEVLREVMRAADEPTFSLPATIDGEPADRVLLKFLRVTERYASPPLQCDLARHAAFLASLPGRSYEEIVRGLE
jgi:hypothetical protein